MTSWELNTAIGTSVAVDLPFEMGRDCEWVTALGAGSKYVSRRQAEIVWEKEELVITSFGSNVTGVQRADGSSWIWLEGGESTVVQHGDRIALAPGGPLHKLPPAGPPADFIVVLRSTDPNDQETENQAIDDDADSDVLPVAVLHDSALAALEPDPRGAISALHTSDVGAE